MSGRLSPAAQTQYTAIAGFADKVQRVYGMVEVFAAMRANHDQQVQPLTRAFGQLKLQLMGAGLDRLSQLAGSMEIAARRGMPPSAKARILREGVGSLKFQIELEMRTIVAEDLARQRKAQEKDTQGA